MRNESWFRIDQVQSVKNVPGLYAWYIDLMDHEATSLAISLSCVPLIQTRSALSFGLQYDGSISAAGFIDRIQSDDRAFKAQSRYLRSAGSMLLPPVYIGRSVRLRDRLQQHVTALERGLSIISIDDPFPHSSLTVPEDAIDTDYESSAFGRRFAERLVSHGDFKLSWIKIRVFPLDSAHTLPELKAVEWLVNRLCRPVLGLR